MTVEDIQSYKVKYVGSAEEEEDLLNFFEENEGDVTLVLEAIPYSSNEDVPRFVEFFESRKSDYSKKFQENLRLTKNSVKPYSEELTKEEAEKEIGNLSHLIQSKNKSRGNDLMAKLLAKYGGADAKMIEYDPLNDPEYGNKTKIKSKPKKATKKSDDPSQPVKKLKKAKN